MVDDIKHRLQEDIKAAMRARDRARLGALRQVSAAIKQEEVGTRPALDEGGVVAVLDKMIKQRRDAHRQFVDGGRQDLADQESFEIDVIQAYLPRALGEDEIAALIERTLVESGAQSMKDMGKVMGALKPLVQGRADMSAVSAIVRRKLGANP